MIPRAPGLLLSLCLFATAVLGQPPAETPPAGAATLTELQAHLAAHLAAPRFAQALWGVKIVSLDTGRTLFEQGADLRMSPASNCKLYPAALALDTWGADHRLHTLVARTAKVDGGVLQGDLVIRGGGDPSWHTRNPARDFWTVFDPFVAVLRQAGVRRVAGDLVADATLLRGPAHGASWTADDMNDYYGAELSALSLEDNYADLRVTPGASAGAPCGVELVQPLTGLVLENRTVTGAPESERLLRVRSVPGTLRVVVSGHLPAGGRQELTEATVPRPAQWFAAALKEALHRAGIEVAGTARAVCWPDAAPVAGVPLGDIPSPPLRTLLPGFLIPSQNLEADLVFGALGETRRDAGTPEWKQSDELAVEALQEFLRRNSLRPEDVRFDEGSGLSRNNLGTAAAFVELLRFMARHREAAAWHDSLPSGGFDGSTLRHRLHDLPAASDFRAKTGGLRWVAALSGYLTTAAGERLAFSLILNRYDPPAGRRGTLELDEIVEELARYRGRG
jgi:D-alanyl-D-alanine carboxypeptidase/D-alanyl-D-alanine-endopeptidase (penicillin-binding protein 4)